MSDKEKIEISINKAKLTKLLVASVIFVLFGLWILIYKPSISYGSFRNPSIKYEVAAAAILFFVAATIFFAFKLKDKRPGLIIDETGVLDNSSAVSAGHIPWSDITSIAVNNVMKQKFLSFIVKNPGDYLNRQSNVIKKKTMEMNFEKFGSPINIPVNNLKCNFDELKTILDTNLANSKRKR